MHSPEAVTCSQPDIGTTAVVAGALVVAGLVTSGVVAAAVTGGGVVSSTTVSTSIAGVVEGGDDAVDGSSLHAATRTSKTTVSAATRLNGRSRRRARP
jgi:hypothetical protein